MEFIVTNIWWVLFFITIAFIFTYKRITKKPDAITSKFEAWKKINGSPNENLEIIMKAMKKAGFRKAGHDERNNR